jgi:hypothetical protein
MDGAEPHVRDHAATALEDIEHLHRKVLCESPAGARAHTLSSHDRCRLSGGYHSQWPPRNDRQQRPAGRPGDNTPYGVRGVNGQ